MLKNYILVNLENGLKGTMEIHIDGNMILRDIDNYTVNNLDDLGEYKDKVLDAIDTVRVIRNYQIKNGIEVFDKHCVVIGDRKQ